MICLCGRQSARENSFFNFQFCVVRQGTGFRDLPLAMSLLYFRHHATLAAKCLCIFREFPEVPFEDGTGILGISRKSLRFKAPDHDYVYVVGFWCRNPKK